MTALEQANSLIRKHALELRGSWQARLLAGTKGLNFKVAVCIITNEWPNLIMHLMHVVHPGCDITRPILIGYATIQIDGSIWCSIIDYDRTWNYVKLFDHVVELNAEFRTIADKLKFNDADREAMFGILRKWVTSDMRVNEYGRRKLH